MISIPTQLLFRLTSPTQLLSNRVVTTNKFHFHTARSFVLRALRMAAEEKSKLQRQFRADRYWFGFFFPESHILSSPYLPFHMRNYFPPPVNRSSCISRRSSPAVCIRALHISHHQPRHMVSAFPLNPRGNRLPRARSLDFEKKKKECGIWFQAAGKLFFGP